MRIIMECSFESAPSCKLVKNQMSRISIFWRVFALMEREFFKCTNMHFYDVWMHPKKSRVSLGGDDDI